MTRTGQPRPGRWEEHLKARARKLSSSRLRYLIRTTDRQAPRDVYAAELRRREGEQDANPR